MKKKLFSFIVFFFSLLLASAQTDDKTQMERERQEIQKEIADLQKAYNQIKGRKKVSLGQANVIKRKIALQERYLSNINRELRLINDEIFRSTLEVIRLQKQLDTLKSQYARSVVYAYKNRSTYDFLNFIFSAGGFNDAMKRVAYLKTYRSYREQQVSNIQETQKLIAERKQQQINKKQLKVVAMQNQSKQVKELETQKKEKDAVVAELKSKEKDIQKELAQKKKRDKDLRNALAAIVRRSIEEARLKAAAEAKKNAAVTPNPVTPNTTTKSTTPAATAPKSYLDLSAKDVALNSSFSTNKGRLPWPVDNGVVCIHYGTYEVEGTKLKGDNPGITVCTPLGTSVKSVFDGEVAAIHNMGDGMAVVVRHGKYFTTYSNLTSVSINRGANVSTGQSIGRAGQADDGNGGQIDFILMIEGKNVNPESWLRRK